MRGLWAAAAVLAIIASPSWAQGGAALYGDGSRITVTPTGTTTPRTLADIAASTVDVKDFGTCTWDGAHDVAPCIQAAIARASALGGGIVALPIGTFPIASTITIRANNVGMRSLGGEAGSDLTFPTSLKWTGAADGIMVSVQPDTTVASPKHLYGNDLIGIMVDGQASAAVGWDLRSIAYSRHVIGFRNTKSIGALYDVVQLSEWNSYQGNEDTVIGVQDSTAGEGIVINCTPERASLQSGNVSITKFPYIHLVTRNGMALRLDCTDNIIFGQVNIAKFAGSTPGAVFFGDKWGQNLFDYLVTTPTALGTIQVSAGNWGNVIRMLDTGNGTPLPIIDADGSHPAEQKIAWTDTNGVQSNIAVAGKAKIGGGVTINQGSQTPSVNTGLTIYNTSDNLKLSSVDGTLQWGINTNGNDLRVVRTAGASGVFRVDQNVAIGSDTAAPATTTNLTIFSDGQDGMRFTSNAGTTAWGLALVGNDLRIGQPLGTSGVFHLLKPLQVDQATPASATAACAAGQISWDATYIYTCVAANSWKRVSVGAAW